MMMREEKERMLKSLRRTLGLVKECIGQVSGVIITMAGFQSGSIFP